MGVRVDFVPRQTVETVRFVVQRTEQIIERTVLQHEDDKVVNISKLAHGYSLCCRSRVLPMPNWTVRPLLTGATSTRCQIARSWADKEV